MIAPFDSSRVKGPRLRSLEYAGAPPRFRALSSGGGGGQQVGDRAGVVGEERHLGGAGAIEAVLLVDQVAQGERAQADRDGVVLVAARHVDVGAGRVELGDELRRRAALISSSESGRAALGRRKTVATSGTGSDRHHRADRRHQLVGERRELAEALLARQGAEVDAALAAEALRIEIGVPKLTQA